MLNCEMTWEGTKLRWRKMYKGKVYVIACSALGVEPTKVGSYKAANEWWVAKRAEIDGRMPAFIHPHAAVIDTLAAMRAWAQGHGEAETASAIKRDMEMLEEDREGDLHSSIARSLLGGEVARAVWRDRLNRSEVAPTHKDRTIACQVARWVELQRARAGAGEIVPAEAENRRHAIAYFESWIGKDLTIDAINEARWTGYYSHLLGLLGEGKRSRSYCEKLLRYARQFIDFLDMEGLLTVPKNLNRLRIKQRRRAVKIMPVEDVRRLISTATGQLRLHLLLMANCGFTQKDISDLHPSELQAGYLVRKRSKTRDEDNDVPEVRYKLWPETAALLERHRSGDPEHLLVTKSGQAWVRKEFKGGEFIETDSIRTLYSRHARRVGIKISLKYIRKTSSTLIDNAKIEFDGMELRRFDERISTLFLGHSPRSIKDRHYSRPAEDVLDEAIEWLRGVYFPAKERPEESPSDRSCP
jgi:hypothetical protein